MGSCALIPGVIQAQTLQLIITGGQAHTLPVLPSECSPASSLSSFPRVIPTCSSHYPKWMKRSPDHTLWALCEGRSLEASWSSQYRPHQSEIPSLNSISCPAVPQLAAGRTRIKQGPAGAALTLPFLAFGPLILTWHMWILRRP